MRRLTLSRAPVAVHCVYFLSDGAVWTDVPTTYSRVGHGTHACIEAVSNGEIPNLEQIACDEELSDDEAARMRDFVVKLASWAAMQNREGWLPEAKLAYSIGDDAGRALASKSPRDYSDARPGEIVGTADVVFVAEAGRMWKRGDHLPWRREFADEDSPRMVVVLDYKTGWGRSVTPIKRNLQLRGLALAAARAFGVDYAMVRIVHIPDDRPVWCETDVLDFFGLGAVAAQLATIVQRAEAGDKPRPGPWCSTCPARVECPETREAMAEIVPPELGDRGFALSTNPSSDEHVKWQIAVVANIEAAIKAIKKGHQRYADLKGAVTLDTGEVYTGWETQTRELDVTVPGAREMLAEAGIEDLVKPSVTIGSIGKKLGKQQADALFDRLKKIGALKVTPGRRYEARSPKGEAA